MRDFRTLLFAPGTRPDRFDRAMRAGSDTVCIDLEDAVAPERKTEAREAAAALLSAPRQKAAILGVRVNSPDSPWFEADLERIGATADYVLIPKLGSPDQLHAAVERLGPDRGVWALIETAEGLMRSWEIAAFPGVAGVLFGAFDYAAEVGCTMEWESLLFARSQLAAACARPRIQLLDAPSGDIKDIDGLKVSTRRAKALGFTGRACIHPDQISVVNEVYSPTPSEIFQAERVITAFDAAAGEPTLLDGKLVELPVALASRRILQRAGV